MRARVGRECNAHRAQTAHRASRCRNNRCQWHPRVSPEGGSFSQNHAHAVLSQAVTIIHPNKNVADHMAAGAHCDSFKSFIRVGTRNPGNTGPLVLGGKN